MNETSRARMRTDVMHGLSHRPKQLSSKYFYDAHGSALFDRITEQPEYYLTRAERGLIASFAQPWLRRMRVRTLIELGAGSGDKTRLLLDSLPDGGAYVPVDISPSYLSQIEEELGTDYPHLDVLPAHADFTRELALPDDVRRPLVIAFIGSTIGNFDDAAASSLLRRTRSVLQPDDRLILGLDLRKAKAVLEAAYNDAAGVTAEFNLNILRVLNRDLGADFDLDSFRHEAFYDESLSRVEMHLVSTRPQQVDIPGAGTFTFEDGETIHTEISRKYEESGVRRMLEAAGLELETWVTDDGRYALAVAGPA